MVAHPLSPDVSPSAVPFLALTYSLCWCQDVLDDDPSDPTVGLLLRSDLVFIESQACATLDLAADASAGGRSRPQKTNSRSLARRLGFRSVEL